MDIRCVEFFNTLKEAREFIHSITWNASVKITREMEDHKVLFAVWYDAPNGF